MPDSRGSTFGPVQCLYIVALVMVVGLVCVFVYYVMTPMVYTIDYLAHTQAKSTLTSACKAYFEKNGKFPNDLKELTVKNANGGPYLEHADALIDPWGQPFQYDPKGPRNDGAKPDIWTVNPESGRVIGNWRTGR